MKLKDYILILIALIGWGLYALDDTLSALIYEVLREGISASLVLQLATFSSVTFIAVKYERHIGLFVKKVEQSQIENNNSIGKIADDFENKMQKQQMDLTGKLEDIRKYINETLASFLSKIKQLNNDHKRIEEQSTDVSIKQENFKQESETLKDLFIRLLIQIVEKR